MDDLDRYILRGLLSPRVWAEGVVISIIGFVLVVLPLLVFAAAATAH